MNELEKPSHVIVNAQAWDFSDPVVCWVTFTVAFGVSMLVVLFFWVRKNMAESAGNE